MRERWRRALPALIGLALFVSALEVLRRELAAVTWPALSADIGRLPRGQLFAALVLTVLNYAVLTGYDLIAFAYVGRRLNRWKVAGVSFLAYAVANNVGFAVLSGASVRFRFYTRWGVSADELSRIVFSYSVTFWLGLLCLGGLSLATHRWPAGVPGGGAWMVPLGWILVSIGVAYVVAAAARRSPLSIRSFSLPMPRPSIAAAQLLISILDWALAATVLWVLLPRGTVPFLAVVSAFTAAQLIGLISHVPGGVGVFEGLTVILLKPYLGSEQLLPALVVYRFVYYVLPLAVALVGLVADEIRQRPAQTARARVLVGQFAQWLTPQVLAFFIFLSGIVLLFSGATPAAAGRLALLNRFVPLGVVETSHFIGSLVGALLLLLSQAVARRLDAAFYLTGGALGVGIFASLLKGADYEEAAMLLALLTLLLRARRSFDRRTALFSTRFSPTWIAAVVAAMVSSIWLGFFAFKHVQYSNQLWWQFELSSEASRFLRASVGAVTVVLLFALSRLIGHAPHEVELPTAADLDDAGAAIARQTATYPYLVYLRDKAMLYDDPRTGFVMYDVQARTWAAMGDPVGSPEAIPGLIRLFLERCDDFGGTPVFYEVRRHYLHHYADFGLTFVKLGEEARVDLERFNLDGGHARGFRQALSRLAKEGATFRIAPASEVPRLIDQLHDVSSAWLASKSTAEKGFSLGFFDEAYLSRFPLALVERDGRVEAFANLWPGAGNVELSIDLMRYRPDAPKNIMETLVVHLLQWGKAEGYRWFALGMAPMSGFEESPVAPLWHRIGGFLFTHGGRLYNFQGLRAFKEKFDPVWEPHYLAYPGGLHLPRVLADVAAIVAGGYRRVLIK